MRFRKLSDEVSVADGPIVQLGAVDIEALKEQAAQNRRRRMRICTHPDVDDPLHEMFIVHCRGAYVRPHKHPGKSEAVHMVEGEADVVFFDEDGTVHDLVRLGGPESGGRLYYRLGASLYHTLIVRSEVVVFHEITNGPFRREDTVFARWAPAEEDEVSSEAFLAQLEQRVAASTEEAT